MPTYDCGNPGCLQCKQAFGPNRTAAVAAWERRHALMSYVLIGNPPEGWTPFDPDALGALIEAYTWITQPQTVTSTGGHGVTGIGEYSMSRHFELTEMLRRAIAKEKARLASATPAEPVQLVMPLTEAA